MNAVYKLLLTKKRDVSKDAAVRAERANTLEEYLSIANDRQPHLASAMENNMANQNEKTASTTQA